MRYLDEVAALLERARANLRDATGNHAEGRFRIAVTVAYYGAFCAAKAVLAFHREGAKTHKGVNKQFFRLAVVDSDFPADTARLLSVMQDQRLSADYDLSIPVDDWQQHDASLAIDRSTRFVNEVEAWLIQNLPTGERFDLRR